MTPPEDQSVVLAGDIGGTKTNLGLFSWGKGVLDSGLFRHSRAERQQGWNRP
jgi:hypothetical protein